MININTRAKLVPRYEFLGAFVEGITTYYDRLIHAWKLIDKNGQEIATLNYKGVGRFENGFALVKNGKLSGCIDTTGKEVVSCKYSEVLVAGDGLFAVKNKKGLWGYVDMSGNEIIPFKYQKAYGFNDGFASVQINGKWNYIDIQGNYLNENTWYDDACSFSEGCARVKKDGLYNFINKNGELISEDWYDMAHAYFSHGLAGVKASYCWGYIDANGEEIVPLLYETATSFSENGVAIVSKGKYYLVDTQGKFIFECPGEINTYHEGLARVSRIDGYNFIDCNGNLISDICYDYAYDFHEGLAAVKDRKSRKWGFIDTKGKIAIPCIYSFVEDFINGSAIFGSYKSGFGLINRNGEIIVPCQYNLKSLQEGMYEARTISGDLIGYMNEKGQIIKDLSEKIYVTDMSFNGVKKELSATTKLGLERLILEEVNKATKALRSKLATLQDDSNEKDGYQKTIGVYLGTEQPKA